jgi:hypothetical protein
VIGAVLRRLGVATVPRMSRTALAWVLVVSACESEPPCDRCPSDAGIAVDAGPLDAGTDAGPQRSCPPGPVAPTPYDCASSEPGITLGEAITADERTWTFVPFADAFCSDGSTTGIGVNIVPGATRVVIYLEGGGACFDEVSCLGPPSRFGASDFAANAPGLGRGLFDRDDTTNPLRGDSFVYVPYCTGDVHGGTTEDGFERRTQVGYHNVTAYLKRIVPTFSGVTEVLLTGRSAGGLGTIVNFEQVQRAFDCVPVHAFDDGGALLGDDYLRPCLQSMVRGYWGLDAIIPTECTQCTCSDGGGLVNVLPYLARRFPDSRFGLATSMEDATFRTFYGYGYSRFCNVPIGMPAEDFTAGLVELRALLEGDENFKTFYVPGDAHTFSYLTLSSTTAGSTTLATWLTQLVSADAAWDHAGP